MSLEKETGIFPVQGPIKAWIVDHCPKGSYQSEGVLVRGPCEWPEVFYNLCMDKPWRILIIEDDLDIGHSLSQALEEEGYHVDWQDRGDPGTGRI